MSVHRELGDRHALADLSRAIGCVGHDAEVAPAARLRQQHVHEAAYAHCGYAGLRVPGVAVERAVDVKGRGEGRGRHEHIDLVQRAALAQIHVQAPAPWRLRLRLRAEVAVDGIVGRAVG